MRIIHKQDEIRAFFDSVPNGNPYHYGYVNAERALNIPAPQNRKLRGGVLVTIDDLETTVLDMHSKDSAELRQNLSAKAAFAKGIIDRCLEQAQQVYLAILTTERPITSESEISESLELIRSGKFDFVFNAMGQYMQGERKDDDVEQTALRIPLYFAGVENNCVVVHATPFDHQGLNNAVVFLSEKTLQFMQELYSLYKRANKLKVLSGDNSEFVVEYDNTKVECLNGAVNWGQGCNLPDGEILVVPREFVYDEGKKLYLTKAQPKEAANLVRCDANGEIIADVADSKLGLIPSPVKITVIDGVITGFSPYKNSSDAADKYVERTIELMDTKLGGRTIGEVAQGTNPEARIVINGRLTPVTQFEKVFMDGEDYVSHLAYGDSFCCGGFKKAEIHTDIAYRSRDTLFFQDDAEIGRLSELVRIFFNQTK